MVYLSNVWRVAIVNCGSSYTHGIHWVVALLHRDPKSLTIVIWDPLGPSSKTSQIIKTSLKEAIPGIVVDLHLTEQQEDSWICGYISLYWWLMIQLLIDQGCMPVDVTAPPNVPLNWQLLLLKLRPHHAREQDRD